MDFDFAKTEKKILKFWKDKKIFEKLKKKNQGKKHWSFIDGPITANNPMGVHHAWGRTYKDLFHRYKALQGFDARYQAGFDCQGLWVEVEVEKEMGFKTKKDIEKFGVAPFVQACKDRVLKYSEIQTKQSIRLGQWMDWENSYYTMSDENNYAIWGFLKKCKEKGLLYKGRDVVPWCPRCGTAISQHEILTEEYKEITHKSIFVKLAVKGAQKTFFLVWTTTPWTLPANVALAVNPKLTYVKIQDKQKNIFICLKDKADLVPEGKIIEEFLGKKLEGLEYQAMFDELEAVKNEIKKQDHKVVLWEDVVEDEGTGIVHIAPGCGQEDFKLSKENKLTAINPTDGESRYHKGFGFLEGKLVNESAESIFKNLEKKELVFRIENYRHRYPTCWRCKSELIFRLVDEWYISMDKLRALLMQTTKKINWIPSFGLDRELDWLKNMQDWLISKKRYWGLALPIYECEKCGNFEVIGSKEELKERAVSGWKKFDGNSPHKPYIDEVKIKCSKCGEIVSRIPDVGNPWLDAGIVSFSTMKYYEDKEFWEKWFPADLISESFPGQFKNWFYSMIVMSAVLENTNPTKTVFSYALVRDEKGEEMHKSKGNAIWFDDAIEDVGADPMRWMYSRQNPAYNLNFSYSAVEEIKRKLLTLYNVFSFLDNYIDKEKTLTGNLPETNNILDKWIISRFNALVGKVSSNLDKYNVAIATLSIEEFFIKDLSLWYVRRSRKRFGQESNESQEALQTLYYVLLNLLKIMSPIVPFFSEEMYLNVKTQGMPESIHLNDWPKVDKRKIDKELEEKMEQIREIVTKGLSLRAESGIKVRQPLKKLIVKNQKLKTIEQELLNLIQEEINVKEIVFDSKIKEDVMLDTKITEELREEGVAREIMRHIQYMRKKAGLKRQDKILVEASGPKSLNKILSAKKDFILEGVKAEDFKVVNELSEKFDIRKEIKIDKENLLIGIKSTNSK